MRRLAIAAIAAIALIAPACGPREGTRVAQPVEQGSAAGSAAVTPAPAPDAAEPGGGLNNEERLAAIQKAMNELDDAVQGCWAASAVARFDIAGELVATIEIERGSARASIVKDTVREPALSACVQQLLTRYLWAPPLHGQTIQLPFQFRAPDGQSVIDRQLVPWVGQSKVSVAVLLDEANTGNAAASMFELALEGGVSTGMRVAERAELWYFLGPAQVQSARSKTTVAAGDMMYVPAGGARNVTATKGAVHAMIAVVPGGREGAARAGALPTRELTPGAAAPAAPLVLPAAGAKTYPRPKGQVVIFAEPATIRDKQLAASVIDIPKDAAVPEHVHAGETEVLYVLAGAGTMTVAGVNLPVGPTSVVQIPRNTKHAFTATSDVRAVQLYTPAGPEQRFKAKP